MAEGTTPEQDPQAGAPGSPDPTAPPEASPAASAASQEQGDAQVGDGSGAAVVPPQERSGALQPHETQPPTQPLESTSAPLDALAGTPQAPEATGGVSNVGGFDSGPGPEDALDPHVQKAGDYSERVDDAAHLVHEPVKDPTLDGPQSAPVAQNEAAAAQVTDAAVPSEPSSDPAEAARQRQIAQSGGALNDDGTVREEPAAEAPAEPGTPAA